MFELQLQKLKLVTGFGAPCVFGVDGEAAERQTWRSGGVLQWHELVRHRADSILARGAALHARSNALLLVKAIVASDLAALSRGAVLRAL